MSPVPCQISSLPLILDFLEVDVLIELGGTFVALWDEMQTDASDMLLGTEDLQTVHLVAFAEMTHAYLCNTHHQSLECTSADSLSSGCLFVNIFTLNRLCEIGK